MKYLSFALILSCLVFSIHAEASIIDRCSDALATVSKKITSIFVKKKNVSLYEESSLKILEEQAQNALKEESVTIPLKNLSSDYANLDIELIEKVLQNLFQNARTSKQVLVNPDMPLANESLALALIQLRFELASIATTLLSSKDLFSQLSEEMKEYAKTIVSYMQDPALVDKLRNSRQVFIKEIFARNNFVINSQDLILPYMIEDFSFKYLFPEDFISLEKRLELTKEKRKEYAFKVQEIIAKKLNDKEIKAQIISSVQRPYVIFKTSNNNDNILKNNHVLKFEILVDMATDIYKVKDYIHKLFSPDSQRYIDLIKNNNNPLLGIITTVSDRKDGTVFEVQIKLDPKSASSELASDFLKEQEYSLEDLSRNMRRLYNTLEFLNSIQTNIETKNHYVLGGNGRLYTVNNGTTAEQFLRDTYPGIFENISQKMMIYVNGRHVSSDYMIASGDIVQIITVFDEEKSYYEQVKSGEIKQHPRIENQE